LNDFDLPTARRIFEHQCKTTFATLSAQSGRAELNDRMSGLGITAEETPRSASVESDANDPKATLATDHSTQSHGSLGGEPTMLGDKNWGASTLAVHV